MNTSAILKIPEATPNVKTILNDICGDVTCIVFDPAEGNYILEVAQSIYDIHAVFECMSKVLPMNFACEVFTRSGLLGRACTRKMTFVNSAGCRVPIHNDIYPITNSSFDAESFQHGTAPDVYDAFLVELKTKGYDQYLVDSL